MPDDAQCPSIKSMLITKEEEQMINLVRSLSYGRVLIIIRDSRIVRMEKTESIKVAYGDDENPES